MPAGLIARTRRFLAHELWTYQPRQGLLRSLTRFLQFSIMVVEGFVRDRLLLRASALAYFTVLSVIPLLAVAVSIMGAVGVGTDAFIGWVVRTFAAGSPESQQQILAMVEAEIDPAVWGGATDPRYLRVKTLRAAELGQGALDAQANAAGPVTSRSLDGVSKSMAVVPAIALGESTTRWGAELQSMLRNSPARAGLVI